MRSLVVRADCNCSPLAAGQDRCRGVRGEHGRGGLVLAVESVRLEREQIQRAGGAVGGVQLDRQAAEHAEFDGRGRVLGHRCSVRKSSVRTIRSSNAACTHGPSVDTSSGDRRACGAVRRCPASDSNFRPCRGAVRPAVSAPGISSFAVARDVAQNFLDGARCRGGSRQLSHPLSQVVVSYSGHRYRLPTTTVHYTNVCHLTQRAVPVQAGVAVDHYASRGSVGSDPAAGGAAPAESLS